MDGSAIGHNVHETDKYGVCMGPAMYTKRIQQNSDTRCRLWNSVDLEPPWNDGNTRNMAEHRQSEAKKHIPSGGPDSTDSANHETFTQRTPRF